MENKSNDAMVRYVIIGTAVVFALLFNKPSMYAPLVYTLWNWIFFGVLWYVFFYHVVYKTFIQSGFAPRTPGTIDIVSIKPMPFLMTQTPHIVHGLAWVIVVYMAIRPSSCGFPACFRGPSPWALFISGTLGIISITFGLKRAQGIFLNTHRRVSLWGNYVWYGFISLLLTLFVLFFAPF